MMNIQELASSFNLFHDLADLPICVARFFAETRCENIAGFFLFVTILVWFYTRCLALPVIIYETYFLCPQKVGWDQFMIGTFTGLMSSLCLLHWYWLWLFLRVMKRYAAKGVTDDTIYGPDFR